MKSGKAAIITTVSVLAMIFIGSFVNHFDRDASKAREDKAVAERVKASAEAKAKADARPKEEKIAEMLKSVATLDEKDYGTRSAWYDQIVALAPENKDYRTKRDYYNKMQRADSAKWVAENAKSEREEKAYKKKHTFQIGASQRDVLDSSWGRPETRQTTTFANGVTSEYWHYGAGNMLHFSNGVLDSVSTRN